ncbi:MAG TPA: hypothetical protein VD767_12200 [Thermomicrobiales bacterium]|nr:hypothetical protein [Thermomicrobiales bacterium]
MAIRKPTEWTIEEARRHLHALIGEAEQAGPQPVEKDDSQEVMIVPIGKWRSGGNLADFFLNSPLRNSGINLEPLPFTVEDFDEWMRKRGTFDDLERLADALVTQAEEPS